MKKYAIIDIRELDNIEEAEKIKNVRRFHRSLLKAVVFTGVMGLGLASLGQTVQLEQYSTLATSAVTFLSIASARFSASSITSAKNLYEEVKRNKKLSKKL